MLRSGIVGGRIFPVPLVLRFLLGTGHICPHAYSRKGSLGEPLRVFTGHLGTFTGHWALLGTL